MPLSLVVEQFVHIGRPAAVRPAGEGGASSFCGRPADLLPVTGSRPR
jgi:hypothetical protein